MWLTSCTVLWLWSFNKNLSFPVNLRHDAGDGEKLSHQVGQVAEHEDEQRLNLTHPAREAGGERRHKAEQDAEQDPADTHHEEAGHTQENIRGRDGWHVGQKGKHAVEDLKRKTQTLLL